MGREKCVEAVFEVEASPTPDGAPGPTLEKVVYREYDPEQTEPETSPCRLALEAVYGDREEHYDHPNRNFERIARLWTAYLASKYDTEIELDHSDIAWLNILQKCSRDMHAPKLDNLVDCAGYAEAMSRLEDR